MQKITDIYANYKILPNLQDHQLRVAAVADIIADHVDAPVDKNLLVPACLLHDMGNIIKFKLDYFPEVLEPEGLPYWQGVQDTYTQKYGTDEHYATIEIVKELGLGPDVYNLVACISFLTAQETAESEDFNKKICAYADMRVSPNGIVSLEDRFLDTRSRYGNTEASSSMANHGSDYPVDPSVDLRELFETSLRQIETQLFEKCTIRPEDITDILVEERIKQLKEYNI